MPSAPVHGPLPLRSDNEDGGAGGRPGPSGALPPATRTEAREQRGSTPLHGNLPFGALLAESALDSNGLLRELPVRVAPAGIPAKANCNERRSWDREACKWRHLMENCVARIKEYRCIAARYDKTASGYAANWNLVAALLASR